MYYRDYFLAVHEALSKGVKFKSQCCFDTGVELFGKDRSFPGIHFDRAPSVPKRWIMPHITAGIVRDYDLGKVSILRVNHGKEIKVDYDKSRFEYVRDLREDKPAPITLPVHGGIGVLVNSLKHSRGQFRFEDFNKVLIKSKGLLELIKSEFRVGDNFIFVPSDEGFITWVFYSDKGFERVDDYGSGLDVIGKKGDEAIHLPGKYTGDRCRYDGSRLKEEGAVGKNGQIGGEPGSMLYSCPQCNNHTIRELSTSERLALKKKWDKHKDATYREHFRGRVAI